VRLSTNIYRPDAPGRFPVLLTRTPYGNGGKGNHFTHNFVRRGYAVVSQDTRGRFESEGVFDALQSEALDGYDTQQWIGKQPWCDGKIGTYGGSYVGFTQWIPGTSKPYLVTMKPSITFTDFTMRLSNGAFRLNLWGLWSFELQTFHCVLDSVVKQPNDFLMNLH
jgi:putative CocE/NonD family hydrolase